MQATILFGHGSRDPLWRLPIDNVADCMRQMDEQVFVRTAFLELTQPDLPMVVAELVALGVTKVAIVPMFLGVGRHAREDLPRLVDDLKTSYPSMHFQLRLSVGEEPRVIELLARIALQRP